MDKVRYAKNGQLVSAEREYNELTHSEKAMIPSSINIEDYKTFRVQYNKQGKLLHVWGGSFKPEVLDEYKHKSYKPDLLDAMTLLNANKHSNAYLQVKKTHGRYQNKIKF